MDAFPYESVHGELAPLIGTLARQIEQAVGDRPDEHLESVEVGMSDELAARCIPLLKERLSLVGIDFVEFDLVKSDCDPCIVRLHFRPTMRP